MQLAEPSVLECPLPPGASPAPVLECRGLRKRFGELEAVRGISLDIAPGETYGLLGPNGAGKTTTISMVCGLLEPDAGEVLVAGRALTTRSVEAKGAIGYVPQELAIYPDLSARENLRFFARLYGMARAEASDRVDRVLAVIGLEGRADERTKNYSGGMQRRLNIGIGLLHRPRLLILDEPTVGVDPQSRNAILESVERLAARGWRSSIRRTTWRRPSGCVTGSGSSTSESSRPRAPERSWSYSSASRTACNSMDWATLTPRPAPVAKSRRCGRRACATVVSI
jgi:ABC-2 type transport system ATP-binding protein